jgi:circadian clock protein KaiB
MGHAHDETRARFELALDNAPLVAVELTLIVSGASDLSARAIANARALCDTHLRGRSTLSIVDLHASPGTDGVVAAPTLIRKSPLPVLRLVGDLSHTEKVLLALDLQLPEGPDSAPEDA